MNDMIRKIRKTVMLPLLVMAVFACLCAVPSVVYAGGPGETVGSVNGTSYSDLKKMFDAIEGMEGRTITITMERDWEQDRDSWNDERLVLPKNSRVTFNLNGHMFNRWLSWYNDWESNGENICIRSGAVVTINGGGATDEHNVGVYTGKDSDNKAVTYKTIKGGVIAGGCSSNGAGGIHVESDVTLILNDVTLAGCRAECPWYDAAGTNSGYGGGIWIAGGNVRLTMNKSTITGCHAQQDGGGIFASNKNNVNIEMNESHVDLNYSRSDGGGIDLDGEKLTIKGDGKSSVSGNETNGLGGGIYLWNDEVTVSGLTISGNKAKYGGGIYTQEETIVLSDLVIKENEASENGGGIYVENDNTTIADCEIVDNKKSGVYVKGEAGDNVDTGFNIDGKTVIRDNRGGNLMMYDGSSHVSFAPVRGMDIRINYVVQPHHIDNDNWDWNISPDTAADCRQYVTSDDANYYVTYSYYESPYSGRRMCFSHKDHLTEITGYPLEKVDTVSLSVSEAAPKVVGSVGAGGDKSSQGDQFNLIRGILHREKTSSGTEDNDSVFYYSDGLFYGDPYVYNNHLATASWNLAFGGTYLREGAAEAASYKYKHTGARQFLADIGCPDQNIYVNDSNTEKPGTDSIGVIIGSKELAYSNGDKTGHILIPIAVRGGGYEAEWASNVLLGSGTARNGEAQGFSEAADQVMSAVEYYIAKYELSDELAEGKVKFWVSGFSRAGATANLTSKRLIEKYADGSEGKKNQVFAYPCEAAKGGTDKAEALGDKTKYYCIHNLINAADIVPLVGPEEMGFKRYGVDHYIPGTEVNAGSTAEYVALVKKEEPKSASRGGSSGVDTVTTYRDNERLRSKPAVYGDDSSLYTDYVARRNLMINNLASIDSEILFNDYFRPRGLSITPLSFGQVGSYQGTYEEDFIIDFLSFMQQESIKSREVWAEDVTVINGTSYGTIQQAARDTMALLFSMSDESKASVNERLASLSKIVSFGNMFKLLSLYDDVLGDWHTLSEKDKEAYINELWDFVVDTGALEFLPEGEAAKLEKNWPVLANMIFNYTDGDWEARPGVEGYTFPSGKAWMKYDTDTSGHYMMYSLTLAAYVGQILRNHDPELNMAWARTYDDYYDSGADLKEYSVNWGKDYVVAPPSAYVRNDDASAAEQDLNSGDTPNELTGNQRIYLDCKDLNGEAIYYTLKEIQGDAEQTIESEQIYRGWIDLTLGDEAEKEYRIVAYARHYGVNSDKVTYNIGLSHDNKLHTIIVSYGGGSVSTYTYAEGEQVTITAKNITDKYFSAWGRIQIGDDTGTDVTKELLGDDYEKLLKKQSLTFTMPESGASGSGGWDSAYTLRLTPQYKSSIRTIAINDLDRPTAGQEQSLDSSAAVSFDNGDSTSTVSDIDNISVMWTYQDGNNIVIPAAGERVYGKTVYTAEINIPKDEASGRIFAVREHLKAYYGSSEITGSNIRRNIDGSVTLKIQFSETGDGPLKPTDLIQLDVCAFDMSGSDLKNTTSYKVTQGNSILLTAPELANEVFTSWDMNKTGVTVDNDYHASDKTIKVTIPSMTTDKTDLTIKALYAPVVTAVSAAVSEPEAGKALPAAAAMTVTITNAYEVHPDNIEVTWTPGDTNAKYLTAYTVKLKLKPDKNNKIKIRPASSSEGSAYTDYDISSIRYSDDIAVSLNGHTENVTYDIADRSLSCTFSALKYKLKSVKPVERIEDMDYTTDPAEISSSLPGTTMIITDDGTELPVAIKWGVPQRISESSDPLESSVWTASGTVDLPDYIGNKDEVSLKVSATVNVAEAPAAASPRASLASGTYLGNQVITLSTAATGGSIKYTVNGSDPTESGTEYNGEEIYFSRDSGQLIDETDAEGKATGRKMMLIRAVTQKSGMRDSNESVYKYVFTNVLEVPKGNDLVWNGYAQTGVSAGLYYTLEAESEGVRIDNEGNAVATEPGTYRVRAKADEGFSWIVTGSDGESSSSADDQIISFSIKKQEPSGSDEASAADAGSGSFADFKVKTTVKAGKKSIRVKWSKVKGAKKYKVAYRKAGTSKWKVRKTKRRSYTIKKLKKGGLYEIRVAPVVGGETGPYSGSVFRYVRSSAPLKVRAGSSSVKLRWKKDPKASGYIVSYSLKRSMKNKEIVVIEGAETKSYTVRNLRKGRRYYVKVQPYRVHDGQWYTGASPKRSARSK